MSVAVVCYLPRHMKKLVNVAHVLSLRTPGIIGCYDTRREPLPRGMTPDDPASTALMFKELGIKCFGYQDINTLRDVLVKNGTKVVVIPETHNLNQVICGGHIVDMCRAAGIKTAVVQHGQVLPQSLSAFIPMNADVFCAWGKWTKDTLVSHGADGNRIVITGYPELDEISKGDRKLKKLMAKRVIELWCKKRITRPIAAILMHTTMTDDVVTSISDELLSLGYYPVIQMPRRHFKRRDKKVCVLDGMPANISISAADVCVTGPSTVVVESIAAHCPTVVVVPEDRRYNMPFEHFGIVSSIPCDKSAPRQLAFKITEAKSRAASAAMNIFENEYVNVDGMATERTCNAIMELL